MLQLLVRLHVFFLSLDTRLRDQRGQATAEYALVLLGAASVALLLAMWAKEGGKVGKLLDAIFGTLIDMVKG
jgi:Flp pilus assembly pilin Flp